MPRAKKQPAVEAVAPVPITGYVRPHTYREFKYVEYPDLPEDAEPLTVKVRANLSFDEIDAIPFGAGTPYADVFQAIAPHVVAWNVVRVALETGQPEAVPPPAEAGWEVFTVLDHLEANWVLDKVKFGHLAVQADVAAATEKMRQFLADAKERASRRSESTDARPNGSDSESAA